jgi:hypothetical protein
MLDLHYGTLSFSELWAQHNDHRMLFGNLIALGLARLGGWSQVRECLASVAITVVGQLFLFLLLRATFPSRIAPVLLVIDSLLLFSLTQDENWLWGFQTVWFLVNSCVFATLWFLSQTPLRLGSFAFATVFAIVGSFSSLFGLDVWLAGIVALFVRSARPRWVILAWSGIAAAVMLLYFHDYRFFTQSGATGFVQHPSVSTSLLYFLIYLGSPLACWAGATTSAVFGSLAVVGYIAGSTFMLIRTREPFLRTTIAPWIALGAFGIGCAVLTTAGRAGFGPDQALASRYITISTTLWIALLSLGALSLSSVRSIWVRRALTAASLTAGVIPFVIGSTHGLDDMRATYAARLADLSAARRVSTATDDELRQIFSDPNSVRLKLEKLRAIGMGPAAEQVDGGKQ